MLPPFDIPAGSFTLVTDELAAPADFLIHQVVNGYIKEHPRPGRGAQVGEESSSPKVVILSANADIAKWKAVSSKHGVNLPLHISSGVVKFVDIASQCSLSEVSEPRLSATFDVVSGLLPSKAPTSGNVVILDDVSTLEWIGFSPLDIIRFVRALRIACHKSKSTLIARYHITIPGEIDNQLTQLLTVCTYHLDVRPLYSGRSGAVTGEIALHRGAAAPPDDVKLIRRSGSLQYRLLDTGPVYFQKGTSEGVL
ncbi:hypothetical protein FA13DRAFT_1734880 [Coprinellus micaceus]|uniref:Elongator complex protein 6 n=1 Tax=Coprinellus micaceus TaxID=71717 RepID=A0A4Y7T5I4_COPMI|nr:hypothetical protein FA13DRAFT_1734880 [Coprinellus micaceus]